MPQSPISRTEGGSVSAIKHFLFGGALDTSHLHQEQEGGGSGGEAKPPIKSNIFRGQILRAQIFKPQILKSQIIKTRIQRSSEFNSGSCESDVNFPNNLRTSTTMTITSSHGSSRSQLPKLNNLSSSSFRHVHESPKLKPQDKECPLYTSSPDLSSEPSTTANVVGGVVSVTFTSGTLPRNFQAKSVRTKTSEKCNNVEPPPAPPPLPPQSSSTSSLPEPSSSSSSTSVPLQSSSSSSHVTLQSSSLSSLPLPSSSSSSVCSSCAQGSNTTFDSGFLSDSTYQDSEAPDPPSLHQPPVGGDVGSFTTCPKQPSEASPQVRVTLHQDNPTYGCLPPHRNNNSTPKEAASNQNLSRHPKEASLQLNSGRQPKEAPPPPRKPGRQVSSVILKIENGLFATASSKDAKTPREGRGRDRRPLDPSSTPPLPPPPSCIIVKEEVPGVEEEEAEGGEEWKRATVITSGAFLARCVKIEDLSNREAGDDNSTREGGSTRHPPERRESGRFPSAARLLRSLARSRDDDSSGARAREPSEPRLTRSNPSYHSEGKGLKKKNNWTSERELNNSLSPTQKERSHSFCDKASNKRRYSYHDNKAHKEDARAAARLDQQKQDVIAQQDITSISSASSPGGPREPLPPTPPSPSSSTLTPTPIPTPTPSSTGSPPLTASPEKVPENIYENLPAHTDGPGEPAINGDAAGQDAATEGSGMSVGLTKGVTRPIERAEKERRSVRKLTKDSGYETSPYSESDYANIDLCSEVAAAAAAPASAGTEEDGDDVTLAPESELATTTPSTTPDTTDLSATRGHDTLERQCSWQPQIGSQDCPEPITTSPAAPPPLGDNRATTPPPLGLSKTALSEAVSTSTLDRNSGRRPLSKYSSAESLSSFAESLVSPGSVPTSSSQLVSAKSTPSLHHNVAGSTSRGLSSRHTSVTAALHASRSTPNLDDAEDGSMVTKSSMYSYLHGAESSSSKKGGAGGTGGRYWDATMGADNTPDREDYAHHLRSSSYQLLHNRQLSALSSGSVGSFHSRQHSNASNYSEPDDLSPRDHGHHGHHHGMDRARFFSYDNLGPEPAGPKYHGSWNMSEPDLTLAPPPYSPPGPGYQQAPVSPTTSAPPAPSLTSVQHSPNFSSSSSRHPSSPPPPPVRDASSLKYIKYGPGHEKYPSWPVPAANQVMSLDTSPHDGNVVGLNDSPSQSSTPQGSHRSKSWTEQSEYPKEKAAGYARPYNKKPINQSFQRQLKTVMERSEKIPKDMFHSSLRDDIFTGSNYSFSDSYYKPSNSYYPLYDRDGRALDDKDYSIPSPPERDINMGEASLGQVTAAQLEEYVRQYEEFGYADLIGTTPLLDQLRRESVMWDGSSERDSGRGESESVADSARYSNGRESVTTVVTNSSSASSSETLKWHGSLSDISVMSGHSRDPRSDHNIVHSSRVQAPQRHNSESVLYYGADGRGKPPHGKLSHDSRDHRDLRRSVRDTESGYPRLREGKWNREVERNNEMNNLKKFPSYSYTQPLSQINEAPTAEMRETPKSPTRSPQSPTIDFSKPPSVAERIHELERQSRTTGSESGSRWPRDNSGSRERDFRETLDRREAQEFRRSHDDSSSQEIRDQNEKLEGRLAGEHWEINESRTHQRRGSRDRELRLDFSRVERKGEMTLTGMDTLRSPTNSTSSWSPVQRDVDGRPFVQENFQNILNSFTEVDRVDRNDRHDRTSNVSYSYLDPEKRRKVSDATLKSIQKQAVMSFYERHTGKNMGGTSVSDLSSASSQSSLISSHSAPEMSQSKWINTGSQNLRTDKSGRAGKGLARLGRVPESDGDEMPHRPGRRRSTSGRDSGSEAAPEDTSRGGSRRSSLASDVASSRGEEPPTLPQKPMPHGQQENSTRPPALLPPSGSEEARPPYEGTPAAAAAAEANSEEDNSSRSSRADPDGGSSSSTTGAPSLANSQIEQQQASRPPSLPPPLHTEPPPRPPERPPKKPTLRSLFHGPGSEGSHQQQQLSTVSSPLTDHHLHQEKNSIDSELLRVEESNGHDVRNNVSPARAYYYRKPPAPDPPKSPELPTVPPPHPPTSVSSPATNSTPQQTRTHSSPNHHLTTPTSPTSRSSTPDLPPPPPPPMTEEEVVVSDEPLPPPPTPSEVAVSSQQSRDAKSPTNPQTYHKDSYMAHRRDWKTGFEGRYRRTVSPSSPNRNPLCTNTTTAERRNPVTTTTTSPSTTSTSTTTASALRNFSTSQFVQSNNSKNLCDDKNINNGWPSSSQNSTTVNFTAEELKAFKARRAHAQDTGIPAHHSQSSPTQSTQPPLTHQGSMSSSSCGVGADSHFGSIQSGSPVSPSKLSPSQSWGTSLDSLNRSVSPAGTPITSSNKYSPRTITRATSLADPLHTADETGQSQEVLQLPRAASINESLSRISAISDSLSRSASVADSLCRSISVTETPTTTHNCHNFTHNRSSSVSDASFHLSSLPEVLPASPAVHTPPVPHDGPITAHPATVTEEAFSLSSKTSPVHSSSPKSSPTLSSSPTSSPTHSSSYKSLESPTSPGSPTLANTSSSALSTSTSPASTSSTPLVTSTITHPATPPTTPPAGSAATLLSASTTPSTSASIPQASSTSSVVSSPPSYPVTSPSMSSPKTPVDSASIIVLGYGRTPYQEELDCDRLSQDYVPQFTMDTKLRALLAPGPEHKTAAHYMQGVFSLELRRDFITSTHANHPDVSQPPRTELPSTTLNSSKSDAANGLEMVCERAPIPADSAYFTTSESKAKMLTRLRGNNETLHDGITDQQQLYKKKEELVASIGRKLEILRAEREAIKEEMRLNHELGLEVTSKVEARARLAEAEKYKLHVEEIDKITSLLLGLSGRLARAENALMVMDDVDPEEKSILERKRDKLSEQLEEAKRLKENIDRRAVQVSKVLNQYLTEDQYADYDHFIKMKAKLIMDAREIDDKIKLGEEQQQALRETMSKKQ